MMHKNQKNFLISILVISFCFPIVSFAQNTSTGTGVQTAPSYSFSVGNQGIGYDVETEQQDLEQNVDPGDRIDINSFDTSPGSSVPFRSSPTITTTNVQNTNTPGSIFCVLPTRPTFKSLINYATCTLTRFVIPVILLAAVVLFIWGVVQYVISTDDETKKKKGRSFMIWGLVSLAVMTSVWGLVSILSRTLGANSALVIPQLHTGETSQNTNQADNISTMPTLPAQQITPSSGTSFSSQVNP
jgi:hypothetical protein